MPVVSDGEDDIVSMSLDRDIDMGCVSVAGDVVERLLEDAVKAQLHP